MKKPHRSNGAICRRLPPRCASDVQCPLWVKSGHMQHKRHVRFTPNSDRESEFPHKVMSAIPPKADMCSALTYVCFGAKADSCSAHKLQRRGRLSARCNCGRPDDYVDRETIGATGAFGSAQGSDIWSVFQALRNERSKAKAVGQNAGTTQNDIPRNEHAAY